ncbi:MAG TPA: hypothetical protein VKU40_10140, partial [Thermoanaerobaculia bacterium]|nr:hypothetical protein [Thermoanaerobaculia bacterium]
RPEPAGWRPACFSGEWSEVAVHERAALAVGACFDGPALVYEAHGATVVEPGWAGEVDAAGALLLRRIGDAP